MDAASIDQLAREWVVREDAGALGPAAAAELQAWLDADPRHFGAYVRARAAWTVLDRARALPASAAAGAPRLRRPARLWIFAGAAAACAALTALLAVLLTPAAYVTHSGETRRVRLPDGSVAVLDANTRIETRFRLGRRDIRMAQGEAWFEVRHDPARPFVVRTGATQVKAVGTAFSVTRTAEGADVIVTHGVVEARPRGVAAPVRLAAGAKAVLAQDEVQVARLSQQAMDSELAWRDGRIALSGNPLREAVLRFNRYNVRKLVLASPELGDVSVVGWFRLDDPESFARAVAVALPARVALSRDAIVIARVPKKN